MPEIRRQPPVHVKNPVAIILSMQEAQWDNLATISNNLANSFHPGFKAMNLKFKEVAYKTNDGEKISYVQSGKISQDFSDGSVRPTGSPLDIALTGNGFFMVAGKDGTFYTRNGQLTIDNNGQLVMSANGYPVLDEGGGPILLPANTRNLRFNPDGTYDVDGKHVGKIGVVTFEKRSALKRHGHSLYKTDQQSRPSTDYKITQFGLEDSNVSPITETVRMMQGLRSYEGAQKIIDEYEQLVKRTQSANAKNA